MSLNTSTIESLLFDSRLNLIFWTFRLKFGMSGEITTDEVPLTIAEKHRDFISMPVWERHVSVVAGIGHCLGARLAKKGFDKVRYT